MQDSACSDRSNSRGTGLTHDRLQLAGIDIKYSLDSCLSEGSKTPTLGSPDTNASSAQRQCLEYVGASSYAAIHQDGYTAFDGGDNFGNTIERRALGFLVTTTMVGHDDPIGTLRDRRLRILCSHDAFDEKLPADEPAQPIDPLKSQSGRREAFYMRYIESSKKWCTQPHVVAVSDMAGRAFAFIETRGTPQRFGISDSRGCCRIH